MLPITTFPQAIQDRALELFCTTFGMDWTAAIRQAEREQAAKDALRPRLTPVGIYVPSTDPRVAGLDVGHIVNPDTLECSCGKDTCRHRGKARTFLKRAA